MGSTPLEFSTTIDKWVAETKDRQTQVFREATQNVASQVTNNLRTVVHVITGFLRASVSASTESMPLIDPDSRPAKGETYILDDGEISLTIAGATTDQTIYLGVTAAYGPYLEYGTEHIAPRGFIRLAAEQWPQIVSDTVDELKSRAA